MVLRRKVRYDLRKLKVKKDRGGYKCYGLWFKKKCDALRYKNSLINEEKAMRKGMIK